ncbi:MAG: alpha-ketoacid dehydrogenase subunit beta [Spirochaetales bacterium]|nr:alpha-ketoacid dehydrogenase subunit beta [Spirochaetales bacterium]
MEDKRTIWYKTAINEAMREEMERDERVFVIGEDVDIFGGVFKITKGLVEKFGNRRVRGTPISESAFIGLAAGAAMAGLRPIVEIMYVDFALVGMDQLVNQAASSCYMSGGKVTLPLVFRGQYGVGTREAAQHSRNFESWFVNTPGIKVVMPSTAYDAKGLLKSAIRDDNPVLYLENRVMYTRKEQVPRGEWLVPLGVAAVRRKGRDITVVATGFAVHKALEAAETLAGAIDVEVIDPRTLDPLDMDTILESVEKTGALLVVQEGVVKSGFAAEVIRRVAEEGFDLLDHSPRTLGAWDVPVPFSPVLEDAAIPQSRDIRRRIEEMLGRKGD